jgi:G3E family GTPase
MRKPAPIPVDILTGFLGAGKTTLLNSLVREGGLANAVVLVNEFGEIALDHLLVEGVEGDMILLASGCLCCNLRGELVTALEDLLRRRDNGRIRPFDRVVIETTGLADPGPVLNTLMLHPYLPLRFTIDSVVTVVDAVNGQATLDAHDEALRQVAVADRLVLTKADLADPGAVSALTQRLAHLNPTARLLNAADGPIASASLFGAGLSTRPGEPPDIARWLNAEALIGQGGPGESHGKGPDAVAHPHDHERDHRHERIRAFCLTSEEPLKAQAVELFLKLLRSFEGRRLLRLKGIVALAERPGEPMILHGAQHVVHEPVRLAKWPDADHSTRIVLIGEDLPEEELVAIWAAVRDAPAPDRPDRQALSDNPLAIRRGGLLA